VPEETRFNHEGHEKHEAIDEIRACDFRSAAPEPWLAAGVSTSPAKRATLNANGWRGRQFTVHFARIISFFVFFVFFVLQSDLLTYRPIPQ